MDEELGAIFAHEAKLPPEQVSLMLSLSSQYANQLVQSNGSTKLTNQLVNINLELKQIKK
jgi:hypothetical protein